MALFELAFCLGVSVFELTSRPWDEVLGWMNYFDRRPYGWRDDDRTFKYLQTQGAKGKPWAYFSSLHPIYNPVTPTAGKLSMKNLKTSTMFQKMLSAQGGDKLEIFNETQNDSVRH